MSVEEFSSSFSTLLNSYAVSAEFGHADSPTTIELDEYEKSLFLTNAQEEIALSLYNGRNSSGLSFEETEELRRYLSPLIQVAELNPITSSSGHPIGMNSNSTFFSLPNDVWFITYESVSISDGKCESHTSMDVYPVKQDEYQKIRKNPFRGANDRRALRFDLSEGNIEIVCKYTKYTKYTVTKYYLRYLRQIKPIILVELDEDTQLRGEKNPMTSELPESLHLRILNRAVEMALASRGYIRNNNENR